MQGVGGGGLFNTPQTGGLGVGLGRGTTGGLGGLGGGTAGGGLFGNRPGGGLFGTTGGGLGAAGGGLGAAGGGGLFGQNTQTQTGGLFNTGGLGGGAGGGLFQTPASQTALGGQQKPGGLGGGLFGQSPALGGVLGGTGGGLFGQTAQAGTAAGGGLFSKSQTPAASIGGGGLFKSGLGGGLSGMLGANQPVKFEPVKAKDTANKNGVTYNVDTLLYCITGMAQHDQKSLEELRFEDYVAGRKGSATAGGAAAGLFGGGQTTGLGAASSGGLTGGGLFGQQNKPLGGGGGLFGQQQTLGGLGAGGLGGGVLGVATTAGGLFAQQQQQPKLGGGGLFATQNKLGGLGGGLGGGTAAGGGLFSQQTSQAATGGLFGQQTTAGGGLFGQQTSTGLGGLGGGLLGQPSQLGAGGGGLFNRTSTAGGLGVSTGLGGLGTTTTGLWTGGLGGGGLGGLGGLSQAGTGLFNKPLQSGALGGLGGGSQMGLGLGGGGLGVGGLGGTSSLGLGTGLSSGLGQNRLGLGGMPGGGTLGTLGNQNQTANLLSIESKREELNTKLESIANQPFGDSPLFRTAFLDAAKRQKSKDNSTPISAKATPTHSPHYKLNMRPSAKFKPMSLRSPARHIDKSKLFESLEDSQLASESSTSLMGRVNETFVPRRNVKKLTIKPKPTEPQPDSTTPPHSEDTVLLAHPQPRISSAPPTTLPAVSKSAFEVTPTSLRSRGTPPTSLRSKDSSMESPELTLGIAKPKQLLKPVAVRVTPTQSMTTTTPVTTAATAPLSGKSPSSSPTTSSLVRPPLRQTEASTGTGERVEGRSPQRRPSRIVLTQQDYYTVPSLDELDQLVEDSHCVVEGFTIGRRGYGDIHFPDKTDVFGMNFDQLVVIGLKEVSVYPDDFNKPAVGQGLNKTAIVRLESNWPVDKTTRSKVTDPERIRKMGYVEKLKRMTNKIGATFINYHYESGTCFFQVEHFSKYKLVADDDDSEGEEQGTEGGEVKKPKTALQAKSGTQLSSVAPPKPPSAATSGHIRVRLEDDEAMSDDEEFKDAVDVTMTTESHPLPVLPSQQLASTMGVSAHRVQIMKASFFSDVDVKSHTKQPFSLGVAHSPMFPTTPTPSSLLSERPSLRNSGSDRHTPFHTLSSRHQRSGARVTPSSMLSAPDQYPHPAVTSYQAQASVIMAKHNLSQLLPREKSLVTDKTHNLADAGLMLGRSFRVGWGPNWTLTHSGFQISHSKDSKSAGLFSCVSGGSGLMGDEEGLPLRVLVEQVNIGPPERASLTLPKLGISELFLSSQLEHSTLSNDAGIDSAPHIAPADGHTLLEKFAELAELLTGDPAVGDVLTQQQLRRALKLVTVLWGPLPSDVDPDPSSYGNQTARRKGVYQWLRETNESVTEEETSHLSEKNYLKGLFSLVSGQQLSKACRLAQQNRDHKLALLLSQVSQNTTYNRTYIFHQLSEWERQKATMYLDIDRVKLYVLLSGQMVWEVGPVNVCKNLDWKRALALHLCYGCGLTASVREVIDKYDAAFEGDDAYAPPPLPPYLERRGHTTPTLRPPLDTCYHLLQLYCYRDHSLELTFAPFGSTPFQLDYRISWLLCSLLSSLGYTHLHPTKKAQLHTSFACQLERCGLWQWAVFVLLHIDQPDLREVAVRNVLDQHCTTDEELTDEENFVIENLRVPKSWVYGSKGQSAGYELKYELEALHLLKAEQWNDCHNVLMAHLAANAIINDETTLLFEVLEELSDDSSCCSIQNWDQAGSVYLDYLRISSKIPQLDEDLPELEYILEQLQTGIEKLATRIGGLPCHTPSEVLCQSEMSKNTANYARVLATLKKEKGRSDIIDLTSVVPHLPLPSDYSLSEFSSFIQPYLKELGTRY